MVELQELVLVLDLISELKMFLLSTELLATVMIMASLTYLWLVASIGNVVRLFVTLLVAITLAYIWSKPHRRPNA